MHAPSRQTRSLPQSSPVQRAAHTPGASAANCTQIGVDSVHWLSSSQGGGAEGPHPATKDANENTQATASAQLLIAWGEPPFAWGEVAWGEEAKRGEATRRGQQVVCHAARAT